MKELIIAALDVKGDFPADSRNGRLVGLLLDELGTASVSSVYLPHPKHKKLRKLCLDLLHNKTLDWRLADCAEYLGVNPKTVQRWFLQDIGMNYGKWRKQARLLMALEKLALGQSILEVALETGYSTPSAFSAMFHREFGMPPSRLNQKFI